MTDQEIKLIFSRNILNIEDEAKANVLRYILFGTHNTINWQEAYEVAVTNMPELRETDAYRIGETYWFSNPLAGNNMQSGGQLVRIDGNGKYVMYNKRYGYITVSRENLDKHNHVNEEAV